MLNGKQRKAVRLLFEMPEDAVAEELGVRPETLRAWKADSEFAAEMRARDREAKESAARIISNTVAHAAARIYGMVVVSADGGPAKLDVKALVDMLKGSGLLGAALKGNSDAERLENYIARIASKPEDADDD
jgi:hypothetical protein